MNIQIGLEVYLIQDVYKSYSVPIYNLSWSKCVLLLVVLNNSPLSPDNQSYCKSLLRVCPTI